MDGGELSVAWGSDRVGLNVCAKGAEEGLLRFGSEVKGRWVTVGVGCPEVLGFLAKWVWFGGEAWIDGEA